MLTLRWPSPDSLRDDLAPHQRGRLSEALAGPLAGPMALLTGTPGTGKTYCVGAVVDAWARLYGESEIAVCAPTGKAAVRAQESIRRVSRAKVKATTIHSKLEIGKNGHASNGDWGFKRNKSNPLDERLVVVDEASMLDTDLSAALLSACPTGCHVLLVGDPYQLPPVGHGAPLRDLIAAGLPCAELTEIRRNAGMIVHACAAIKDGREWGVADWGDPWSVKDAVESGNLRHVEAATPEAVGRVLETLLSQLKASQAFDPTWAVQVISGTNRTRKVLNKQLQTLLNPYSDGDGQRYKHPFRQDDKIICLRNHFAELHHDRQRTAYVANGEIGRVADVEERGMVVEYYERPPLRIPIGKIQERGGDDDDDQGGGQEEAGSSSGAGCHFDLAYCVTGHKMQGSESPCAIVVIEEGPGVSLVCSKNWLYTSLSRASKLCVTVGREGVMRQMAKRESLTKRKTFLRELITTW